ncbi:MAG: PAS domain S-box protein [Ignavibacteria bacterium]
MQNKTNEDLMAEVQELRTQLEEAQDTLDAIRRGEVDGLVVSTPKGEQVYTISGAERPYRALIEDMREGAVILSDDDTILYCNSGFAKMMKRPSEKIVGVKIESMVCPTYIPALIELLTLSRAHKGAITKEVTLQAREDVLVPTLMSVNSLQSDTLKNTFLVVTDLSEHMDEEVKRYTQELEIAQIALSESEQRWATTLASIGDAVIATDKLGKIKFMNGVAEDLTGWTLKEASKRPVQEIFKIISELSRKTVDDPVSKVLEKGMICGLANHTILIRKDKSEVAIDDSGAPIKDKEGQITGVVLIFRDITGRRKVERALEYQKAVAQQEKDRLSSLLNSMTDEVWFADSNKNIALVNPAAINEFKLDTMDTKKVRAIAGNFEVYRADGTPRPVDEAPPLRALKGEVLKNQLEIVKTPASGELRYRQVSAAPVKDKDGNIIGSVSVVRDISELKLLQNRLEKYNQDLERTVKERTKQLQEKERLAAIGATAGMVGHDIRNPLQAIVADLYIAKGEIDEIPNVECKRSMLETIAEIEKNVDYINKIVADLQDFARPLKPNIEEADLKRIIDDVLSKNGLPENIKASVNVEVKVNELKADASFINRIMNNLVSNAVQAMPKGGTLAIHAYKEANDIVIKVKDTGIGIPDGVKPKLFTPMFTTKAKGQGFGLVVIKRMTEALGGTVSFDSQEGKGTTFKVRLPAQEVKP